MLRVYLVFLLLICSIKSQAQLIIAGQHTASDYFHDVVPDSTFMAYYHTDNNIDTMFLDLDHDGANDFVLNLLNCCSPAFTNLFCRISTLNNNQIAFGHIDSCFTSSGMVAGVWQMAHAFHIGDTISENVSWATGNLYLTRDLSLSVSDSYYCVDDAFPGPDALYLGAKILSGNDTLYGWIKVTGVGYIQCTVLEYASNADSLTIINKPPENVSEMIYPNPFTSELHFTLANSEPSQLVLYNVLSQKFIEQDFVNSINLNTSGLLPGIYFYRIQNGKTIIKGKLVRNN